LFVSFDAGEQRRRIVLFVEVFEREGNRSGSALLARDFSVASDFRSRQRTARLDDDAVAGVTARGRCLTEV
jgi:hypothetical protein